MEIITDFDGANIKILSQNGDCVHLDVELRDTSEDWFYWCFKVKNAGSKTVTFNFPNRNRVGYYGAAVSYDYKKWHWQYTEKGHQGDSFTYTFEENENSVYFAHDMLYRPERFLEFAENKSIDVKTLCTTKKGNDVPYIDIGVGNEILFLTARHHACESSGSYVLEGVLEGVLDEILTKDIRIICVPFVDYDGVIDGDQGKGRSPYDHNRDYDKSHSPIYEVTRQIRNMADALNVKYAFDFHSPWHLGNENDTVFIPVANYESINCISEFSKILENKNQFNSLPHYECDDFLPDISWNKSDLPNFANYFHNTGAKLSFTLETPYFFATDTPFSIEKAINLGKNFAKSIKEFENREKQK